MALSNEIKTDLFRFFAIAFDAAPGTTYMDQLTQAVDAGMTVPQIVEVFTSKLQFTSVYPESSSSDEFATLLINNVVGASASDAAKAEAMADVSGALAAGWTRGQVIYQIFSNLAAKPADDATWGGTAKMMANQVAVAQYATEVQLVSTANLAELRALIADVTADTDVSTPEAIQSIITDALRPAGQTFSLTTASETKSLTTGNDTIDGAIANSINNDALVDTGGTDVLTAVITADASAVISDVETINMDFKGFNLTFNATNVSNGNIVASTTQSYNDKATITNLSTKGATVEVASSIKNLVIGGSSGSTDATTVKLAGGDLALTTTSGNNLESVALVSTGSAANVVTLTNATAAETFAVTGDKSLTLKVAAANITGDTLTKSLTGGATVEVQLTTGAADTDLKKVAATKFTTASSGNTALGANAMTFAAGTTTLELNQADLSSDDTVGKGFQADGTATNDVLNMTWNKSQSHLNTGGFETVNLSIATGADVTLTNAVHTVGGSGVLNVSSAYNVNFGTTAIVAKEVNASGMTGTGKLTVSVANNATNSITVTGTANADSITVAQTTADKTATINAGEGANTIVASASSQKVTINTGSGNDTITGGSGNDVIISGAGNDTLVLTAGNNYAVTEAGNDSVTLANHASSTDTVVLGSGDDVVIAGSFLTAADTLDGGDGTDALTVTHSGTTGSLFDKVTNFESIDLTLSTAGTVTTVDALVASGKTLTVLTAASALTWDGAAETDGKFDITLKGAAAHQITGGAGDDAIKTSGDIAITSALFTGGKGGDFIDLSSITTATKADTGGTSAADAIIKQAKGDSLVVTGVTDGMSFTGSDVVKFGATGAEFSINTGNANIAIVGSAAPVVSMPTTLANDSAYVINGTYNTSTKTFTAGAATSTTDFLMVYDADSTSSTQFETVIIIGTNSDQIRMIGGVVDFQVAS